LLASAALWNIGSLRYRRILLGYSQGVEWLEFPLPAAALVAAESCCRRIHPGHFRQAHMSKSLREPVVAVACVGVVPFLYVIATMPIYSAWRTGR
jgi:hypothetical protein